MELDGKVALVTGGARGQGAAHARRFVDEGASVVVLDVLDELGEALVAELGPSAIYEHLDVSDEIAWSSLCTRIQSKLGGIDILVNNAAIRPGPNHSLSAVDLASFSRVLDVNVVGTLLGMKHVAEPMARRGGGAIVNVSSIAGTSGSRDVAYGTSKWAIRGLTKSAARVMAPDGIRVNAVLPGPVATEMVFAFGGAEETLRRNEPRLLIKRLGEVDEITEGVLFLVSDRSRYTTGSELVIDGGMTAT